MAFQYRYITPDIKLSCYAENKLFKTEILFDQHMLVWFITGETKIIQADEMHIFKAGDIFLIPRNQVGTVINYPKDGLPHKTVVMHLSVERLQAYYAGQDIRAKETVLPKIRSFGRHPLLESCLASLIPYFDMPDNFPANIASLKINEAISILRIIDPSIDSMLMQFSDPGKIDLAKFMEKNFMFNMPLEKFGYLSGRSLSTFHRDFKKIYSTPPQKWLLQKRLELAHYLVSEKQRKPADVYLEAGFEDLSHFSFAFKKHYGYTPASLLV